MAEIRFVSDGVRWWPRPPPPRPPDAVRWWPRPLPGSLPLDGASTARRARSEGLSLDLADGRVVVVVVDGAAVESVGVWVGGASSSASPNASRRAARPARGSASSAEYEPRALDRWSEVGTAISAAPSPPPSCSSSDGLRSTLGSSSSSPDCTAARTPGRWRPLVGEPSWEGGASGSSRGEGGKEPLCASNCAA